MMTRLGRLKMHRVEIPIWQDEDAKPIEGFTQLTKTVIKHHNGEVYRSWFDPELLDSGFNPDNYELTNTTRVDKGDYTQVTHEFRYKPTLIEQYKKAAMYE